MKKLIGISVVVLALVVIVVSLDTKVDVQPAQVLYKVPTINQKIGPATNHSTTIPKGSNSIPQEPELVIDPAPPNKTIVSPDIQVSPIKTIENISTENIIESPVKNSGLFSKKKKEKFWCEVNGDGTITYGTATWTCERHFLFFCTSGSWNYGIGLTAPGNANSCAGFLEGV